MERRRIVRRRLVALVGAALLALPASALAGNWAEYYAALQTFQPGGVETSGSNYGLNYNTTIFSYPGPCCRSMALNLCAPGSGCYPYHLHYQSFSDYRTISYGYAKCTAYNFNDGPISVNQCYTSNY
jgi:hypothetical protein